MQKNGNTHVFFSFLAILLPVSLFSFFSSPFPIRSATSGNITATVAVGVCGNNIVEHGEACDGSALDGQTCLSRGFDGGTLSCNPACEHNLSECINLEPEIETGSVVFSGKAYPQSIVRILKDGQIAATTSGDADGNFETTLSDLTTGSYIFSIYAYDNNGARSKTLTYHAGIGKNAIRDISGIIVPPTLAADSENVIRGKPLIFSGQSVANSLVEISAESARGVASWNASSNSQGYYSLTLDTDIVDPGSYASRAKTTISGPLSSSYSEDLYFNVNALISQTSVLGGMDLTTWKCIPQTTKRKPVFQGATNAPGAIVKIEIRTGKKKKIATVEVNADVNGNWTWINPVRLKRKNYTTQISVRCPSDPSINYSYSQPFKLVKKIKKSTRKKCQVTADNSVAKFPDISLSPAPPNNLNPFGKKSVDFNGDARTNLIDAAIFVDQFKSNNFAPEMDANADGKIDLGDFSILAHEWSG